jgi:hypothetical protein
LCNRDIAINFGVIAREEILVDSCAVIFICCDCYLFCFKKMKQNFCLQRYCSYIAAVLFKTDFLVELELGLLFPKGKQHSEQD